MRTKALLLTVALSAAGIATSMAQVYSVNAVGYVNLSIPHGPSGTTFAIASNPLNGSNNLLSTIIPAPPDFTTVYLYRSGTFAIHTFLFGSWDSDDTIPPGEGFFLAIDSSAPNPTVITFVGEVPQGSLSNPLPPGFSLRASQVPQEGLIQTDLGLPPGDFDEVYQFDVPTQNYVISTFLFGSWGPSEPTIKVAEGFWYNNASAAKSWDRNFSVN
jgi:hypothetical protein